MFINENFVRMAAVVSFATLLTVITEVSGVELLVCLETTSRNKLLSAFGARVLPFLFADFISFERALRVKFLTIKKEGKF